MRKLLSKLKRKKKNGQIAEEIVEEIQKVIEPSKFQKRLDVINKFAGILGLVVAIAGLAVAIIFSIWGIRLTKKFGENKDQLNKLTELAKTQDSQLSKQDSQLEKLTEIAYRQQNAELQLRNIFTGLIMQQKIAGRSLNFLALDRENQIINIDQNSKHDYFLINEFCRELGRTISAQNDFKNIPTEQYQQIYLLFKNILSKEKENRLLLGNDSLYLKLENVNRAIETGLNVIRILGDNVLVNGIKLDQRGRDSVAVSNKYYFTIFSKQLDLFIRELSNFRDSLGSKYDPRYKEFEKMIKYRRLVKNKMKININ